MFDPEVEIDAPASPEAQPEIAADVAIEAPVVAHEIVSEPTV